MAVQVLDYYRIKPEFMPADLQQLAIYVRPAELHKAAEYPEHWEFVGRTLHPNRLQVADVERQGFCVRKLRTGINVAALAATLYGSDS
jgi:hypothetical protein